MKVIALGEDTCSPVVTTDSFSHDDTRLKNRLRLVMGYTALERTPYLQHQVSQEKRQNCHPKLSFAWTYSYGW